MFIRKSFLCNKLTQNNILQNKQKAITFRSVQSYIQISNLFEADINEHII